MIRISRRDTLAGAGLILLMGCGGGGGSSPPTGSGPTPMPTPTPTPSPTPSAPPPDIGSFGTLGVTTSQSFATLGNSQQGNGSGWDFVGVPGSLSAQPGHAIRFAAPSSLLLMIPGFGEGELVPRGSSDVIFNGELIAAYFDVLNGMLTLSRPVVADRLQRYVMQGYFVSDPEAGSTEANLIVAFSYGIPTPPNALPTSGSAQYQTTFTESRFSFSADYSSNGITGAVPFYVNGPALVSEFRDVIISEDGTGFSGRLIPPDGSAEGTVQGRFMGPTGEEFIAQAVIRAGQSILLFSGSRTS